jgi:hypothetical protein
MRRLSHTLTIIGAAVLVAGVIASPSSAGTVSSNATILQKLNAQRAAHGLGGGVVEDSEWSDACLAHNKYMEKNKEIDHPEQPGNPGYTEAGAWAGPNAVLAYNHPWKMGNPWEMAPFHLQAILNPRLTVTGISEYAGTPIYAGQPGKAIFDCMIDKPGFLKPAPESDTFYSYPGDGTRHRFYDIAVEDPRTPGQAVGIPQGTVTGPNIIAYWDGPTRGTTDALDVLTTAEVTGPQGQVDIEVVNQEVDDLTPPGTGFVIPRRALTPSTPYSVSFTFSNVARTREMSHAFTFTTKGAPTARSSIEVLDMRIDRSKYNWVRVQLGVKDPFIKKTATVFVDYFRNGKRVGYIKVSNLPLFPVCDLIWFPQPGKTSVPTDAAKVRVVVPGFQLGETLIPKSVVRFRVRV